jgi:hypothetical protein
MGGPGSFAGLPTAAAVGSNKERCAEVKEGAEVRSPSIVEIMRSKHFPELAKYHLGSPSISASVLKPIESSAGVRRNVLAYLMVRRWSGFGPCFRKLG